VPKRSLKRFLNKVTCGDMRDLLPLLPPNSVDVVFTDPPWCKDMAFLYEVIAEAGARVIKPHGWCFAYSGGFTLPEAMQGMHRWLAWFWLFKARLADIAPAMQGRRIRAASRDVLVFTKGTAIPRERLSSDYEVHKEKKLHPHQQSADFARHILKRIARHGQVLLDPCTGSGTFPAVAKELGMDYIAFDVDPEACKIARARLRKVRRPAT